jgi:hypothetical protein
VLEDVPLLLVAPQVRDVDRHAVEERVELIGIAAQQLAVGEQVGSAAALDPGADPPLHLAALVLHEVDAAEQAHPLAQVRVVVERVQRVCGAHTPVNRPANRRLEPRPGLW